MIKVEIYECEYCHKKRLKTKKLMQKHENVCYFNPKNKACVTCANYNEHEGYHGKEYECKAGLVIAEYEHPYISKEDRILKSLTLKYKCSNWKSK